MIRRLIHLAPALFVVALACSDSTKTPPPSSSPEPATDAGVTPDAPGPTASCEPGAREGEAQGTTRFSSAKGRRVIVRTPETYDPLVGAPLVVVYAPAVASASDTEGFIGLTGDANARGFIVAYVDHIAPGSSADVTDAASVVERVSSRWCVDPARVYLTGHSDGATLSWFIAQRGLAKVAAIAPSAAGVRSDATNPAECPKGRVPAMVMHGRRDAVFPITKGYGANVAAWWAKCCGCTGEAGPPDDKGCVTFGSCPEANEVRYCEWGGAHPNWPPLNGAILDFFDRWPAPR